MGLLTPLGMVLWRLSEEPCLGPGCNPAGWAAWSVFGIPRKPVVQQLWEGLGWAGGQP